MEIVNSSWYRIKTLDLALCLRCNRISRYRLPPMFFRGVSRLGDRPQSRVSEYSFRS